VESPFLAPEIPDDPDRLHPVEISSVVHNYVNVRFLDLVVSAASLCFWRCRFRAPFLKKQK
jgi:hypothetical protein